MSTGGSMTCLTFKESQLEYLIDVILDANGDANHAYHHIVDMYPTDNVYDDSNINQVELDAINLTNVGSSDAILLSNATKKCVLALKGFWQSWGDKLTQDWTPLSLANFEEYLLAGQGPQTAHVPVATPVAAPAATAPTTTLVDVTTFTNALSAAMLSRPLSSCTDIFMKNIGGGMMLNLLKSRSNGIHGNVTFVCCPCI